MGKLSTKQLIIQAYNTKDEIDKAELAIKNIKAIK